MTYKTIIEGNNFLRNNPNLGLLSNKGKSDFLRSKKSITAEVELYVTMQESIFTKYQCKKGKDGTYSESLASLTPAQNEALEKELNDLIKMDSKVEISPLSEDDFYLLTQKATIKSMSEGKQIEEDFIYNAYQYEILSTIFLA